MPIDASTLATIFILASAFLNASSSAFFRAEGDRFARVVVTYFISLSVMIPVTFFVPFPSPELWQLLITSSLFILTFQLCSVYALSFGALSYTYPLTRGSAPAFVFIISLLFFDEPVELSSVIGVCLVVGGILELSTRGIREVAERDTFLKATGLALFSGFMISIYTLIDASAVRSVENPFTYISWLFILVGVLVISSITLRRGKSILPGIVREWKVGLIAGSFGFCSYLLALLAFRYGSTIEISALRETSIMFAVLIGYLFLGEGIGVRRLVAVTFVAIGAVVLKMY